MIKALRDYFFAHDYRNDGNYRRIQFGRIALWGYGVIAFFMFGHIYVTSPVVDSNCDLPSGVEETVEACGKDKFFTGMGALIGAAAWPLVISVEISEELSE